MPFLAHPIGFCLWIQILCQISFERAGDFYARSRIGKSVKATVLKRVFLTNGQTLQDPDPSMSPAQVKDMFSAMYPELLNAEIQGPVESDTELTFTFHRTTGTKGRTVTPKKSVKASKLTAKNTGSFMQRLDNATGEAPVKQSLSHLMLSKVSVALTPQRKNAALHLPTLSCPLLV